MIRLARLIKSFKYAFSGFRTTFKEEQNLQIQVFVGVVVLALAYFFKISKIELVFLIISIGLVMLMEIVNSAVERVTDILKPRIHDFVMEIKDIMAAAVMFASLLALIVGVIIFYPYFIALII